MKKQEVDHILTRMLDSHSNVSDLNITVGNHFRWKVPVNWCPLRSHRRSRN